ncbi:MAG: C25 family cysteine peptidase [Candidatus Cloacimonadales bacterium]|nr:C25 family cysteine peptidase [Candidatus Cloacimonadales bacterium]
MKQILIVLTLILSITLFSIDIELVNNQRNVRIRGDFTLDKIADISAAKENFVNLKVNDCRNTGEAGEAELPVFSKLVTLPATGNFKITNIQYDFEEIDLTGKIAYIGMEDNESPSDAYYTRDKWLPENIISVGKPNIMRSHRFAQVTISAVQYNPALNRIRLLKNVDFDLEIDDSDLENPLTRNFPSQVFDKLAAKNIIGVEETTRSNAGQYLIICPASVAANLTPLVQEKQKLGFRTRLATLSETGTTADNIKNYIQNAYDTWEYPPEYVILVGDVNGSVQLPSFFVEGTYTPWDVSDHPYTLLAGDDYFPDILIGRISVQSSSELNTVVNKIVSYELNPYIATSWTTKGLMVSYVQNWYWEFFSPRETVMEVREKLLDYEFTAVDTFIDPWNSGSSNLRNMINNGYTFVNYRGAGAPDYWAGNYGSMFGISDIVSLTNGQMLPMVTSMTCGGGDFAYSSIPSVFGETWLIAGTQSVPKGAIAFIGPSEHDTKTWFNNANDMGIYQGVTQEYLFRCGEMLLRGKMELYLNYPFSHAWGSSLNSDQFYFYVYNLLGDPGLQVWTTTPQPVAFDFEAEINSASNFLSIDISNPIIDGLDFIVAITNDDSLITTGFTDASGIADIPIDLPAGTYYITASRYGFIPQTETFQIVDQNIVALDSFNLDQPISGSEINLLLYVKNFGDQTADNIEINLNTDNPDLEITSGSASIATLEPDQVSPCIFSFNISPQWQNTVQTELFADITSSLGYHNFIIPFCLISPEVCLSDFIVQNTEECLLQNETNTVFIELLNCGALATGDLNVQLIPQNDNISILTNQSTYSSLSINSTGLNGTAFEVACAEVMSGELASFRLEISNEADILQDLFFSIPIGEISEESPTFCDYGYYAIESSDSGYLEAPVYDWIEISTYHSGSGTEITPFHVTPDGMIDITDLPFEFRYFGEIYDQVSICSNGYLSMGETELIFARNRNIPSGVGSRAMIAPFWDNLTNGHVFYKYYPDDHYFVIEWSDMRNVFNYSYETFEVILYDPEFCPDPDSDGPIKFQYQDIHNVDQTDQYATVGIENEAQTEGLLLTYANVYAPTAHTLVNNTAIFFSTTVEPQVSNDNNLITKGMKLYQNYPNPFNPSTTISFTINTDSSENTELVIYNLKGQKVKTFTSFPNRGLGTREVVWNGTDENAKPVGSGVYFFKLMVGNKVAAARKCVLLK